MNRPLKRIFDLVHEGIKTNKINGECCQDEYNKCTYRFYIDGACYEVGLIDNYDSATNIISTDYWIEDVTDADNKRHLYPLDKIKLYGALRGLVDRKESICQS